MIEIVDNNQDVAGRNLDGMIVVGGLPLSRFDAWFPAVPVIVRKSTAVGFVCDRVDVQTSESGRVLSIQASHESEAARIRPEYVRSVCDAADEAISLLNAQPEIELLINEKSGNVPDLEIARDIREIYEAILAQDAAVSLAR